MGMYTEISFSAEIKNDPSVVQALQGLLNGDTPDIDHPFFRSERTWLLRSGGSYYFPKVLPTQFEYDDISKSWFLGFRTNIKNYDREIQKFLDWIKPYILAGSGMRDMYAVVIYEESDEPTIYYLREPEVDHG